MDYFRDYSKVLNYFYHLFSWCSVSITVKEVEGRQFLRTLCSLNFFVQLKWSLSKDVFERRTSAVGGLLFFFIFGRWFSSIFGQIVSIIVKTLRNTNLVASKYSKMKTNIIPVDVSRSKPVLHKLPNSRGEVVTPRCHSSKISGSRQTVVLQISRKTEALKCMIFLCLTALKNKTVFHTILPSFANANALFQERLWRSRSFATMVTWRYTSPVHIYLWSSQSSGCLDSLGLMQRT